MTERIDPWLSAPEAAKALGIAVPTLYLYALRGEVQWQVVAGSVFVHRDSVPQQPERPAAPSTKGATFGERLRMARIQKSELEGVPISQVDLGRMVGTTGVTIGRYENDSKEPSHDRLKRIADALGCSVGWLVNGEVSA